LLSLLLFLGTTVSVDITLEGVCPKPRVTVGVPFDIRYQKHYISTLRSNWYFFKKECLSM
jgi:hypothetical protein